MADRKSMLEALSEFEALVRKSPNTPMNCSIYKFTTEYLDSAEYAIRSAMTEQVAKQSIIDASLEDES